MRVIGFTWMLFVTDSQKVPKNDYFCSFLFHNLGFMGYYKLPLVIVKVCSIAKKITERNIKSIKND